MESKKALSPDPLLKLALTSDPQLLQGVRGQVEQLAASLGFPEPDCRAITRAVDEALTNIIRHTYEGKAQQPIEVVFRMLEQAGDSSSAALEIQLHDHGPCVHPEKWCSRALEDVRPGGLGLHFIQQGVDVMEYSRVNGTNCLRLVKRIKARQQKANS